MPSRLFAAVLLLSTRAVVSFAPALPTSPVSTTQLDATVGIYFGTVGGNTKTCANHIMNSVTASANNDVTICEIENLQDPKEFTRHDALIIGAPTWNTGAEKERTLTGWDAWLYNTLPTLDLKEKKVALFGVGDQGDYPFNCTFECSMLVYEIGKTDRLHVQSCVAKLSHVSFVPQFVTPLENYTVNLPRRGVM